jgi:hypothetical protein
MPQAQTSAKPDIKSSIGRKLSISHTEQLNLLIQHISR